MNTGGRSDAAEAEAPAVLRTAANQRGVLAYHVVFGAYGFWPPPAGSADTVLCVGEFSDSYLRRFWSQVRLIAPLTLPAGLHDHETTQHAAIYLCQQPHGTWAQLWPGLRRLS